MTINDKIIIHGIGMEGSPNRQGLLKLLKESGMTFQVVQENTHEFNEIQKLRKVEEADLKTTLKIDSKLIENVKKKIKENTNNEVTDDEVAHEIENWSIEYCERQ